MHPSRPPLALSRYRSQFSISLILPLVGLSVSYIKKCARGIREFGCFVISFGARIGSAAAVALLTRSNGLEAFFFNKRNECSWFSFYTRAAIAAAGVMRRSRKGFKGRKRRASCCITAEKCWGAAECGQLHWVRNSSRFDCAMRHV